MGQNRSRDNKIRLQKEPNFAPDIQQRAYRSRLDRIVGATLDDIESAHR
jgi:hypothetical protein